MQNEGNQMITTILSIASPVLVGLFLLFFKRAQDKKDTTYEENYKARCKESLLSLEMITATADLSYATAIAVKRGYANGEVEVGIESYEKAKESYRLFMTEQATKSLVI